jgi:ABC-type uncharacterized transport system, permease component
VLPLAFVASLLPLAFNGVRVLPYSAAPMFKLHFLIANIAYGLFAIAALHAVLMLLVERRLHAMRGGVATECGCGGQRLAVELARYLAAAADTGKAAVPSDRRRLRAAHADAASGICSASNWSTAHCGSITRPCSRFFPG